MFFASVMLGALLPECHYHIKSSDQNNGACLCIFSVSAINLATINKFLQDHCWFIFFDYVVLVVCCLYVFLLPCEQSWHVSMLTTCGTPSTTGLMRLHKWLLDSWSSGACFAKVWLLGIVSPLMLIISNAYFYNHDMYIAESLLEYAKGGLLLLQAQFLLKLLNSVTNMIQ